jgi:hypothetical protein
VVFNEDSPSSLEQICSIETYLNNVVNLKSHSSSVSIVTRLWAEQLGFNPQQGLGFFHLATTSSSALGPSKPLIQWVLGVKQLGHEVDHSSPTIATVKDAWSCTSIPTYIFMVWVLIKYGISSWCGA